MIRITGGQFRGRNLVTPAGERTRPTSARLRQAMFNSIQGRLEGAHVLDFFAGSGALAFEALSRGASSAVLVEDSRAALRAIEKNAQTLAVGPCAVVLAESVESVTRRLLGHVKAHGPFDLVFADPPYAAGWELRLLQDMPWAELLSAQGLFCLEWGALKSQSHELPDSVGPLVKIREKIYGEAVLTTYELQ